MEDDGAASAGPPSHPVAQLQGPFEESMMESVNEIGDNENWPDPAMRRKQLLERKKVRSSLRREVEATSRRELPSAVEDQRADVVWDTPAGARLCKK